MTQLQERALEHIDSLLIDAHNRVLRITEEEDEIGMIATKGYELAKDIHEIQMWCRLISSDPMPKTNQ